MMSIKTKKGRNPAVVDNWLDSIGLYRKNVAYDETCLFRAVSEQLFDCQIYHERVRIECIEYGREHYDDFWHLLETERDWYNHLDLLEKHMVVCGNLEMQLVSHKYNCDVIVYDAARQHLIDVTARDLDKTVSLCLMGEDHYDVVHPKEHVQNTGFAQSIVYNILYEKVFHIPKVPDIVRGMLYEKEYVPVSFNELNNNNEDVNVKIEKDDEDSKVGALPPLTNMAPFPFKVAKALDPTIYRNIEYDAWTEVRRELRLGEWYYGDDNLILGTRCIYNVNDETYECYIQEIIKKENKCIVFITKLGEKKTVNYSDLSPENDAKPWPLPYRFTKNLVVTPSQSSTPLKIPNNNKKRKDKRRSKSNSESQTATHSDQADQDIEAFIGFPLMQNHSGHQSSQSESPPDTGLSQHNLLVTPEISSPMPKFSWDTPWTNVTSGSTDKFVWTQPLGTPPNLQNYNMKPMVASAPVTPNVVPYHDSQYPFVYNYLVDNYDSYGSWSNNSPEYIASSDSQYNELEESKEKVDNCQCQEVPNQSPPYVEAVYEPPPPPRPIKERPTLPIPNPQPIEVYSPVIPIQPGTPVIYAHPSEVPEVVVPAPPFQVYTPPLDVQYVSPGSYFYSPTIPTTWYPVGINSQGFIFPTPTVNQNLQTN